MTASRCNIFTPEETAKLRIRTIVTRYTDYTLTAKEEHEFIALMAEAIQALDYAMYEKELNAETELAAKETSETAAHYGFTPNSTATPAPSVFPASALSGATLILPGKEAAK